MEVGVVADAAGTHMFETDIEMRSSSSSSSPPPTAYASDRAVPALSGFNSNSDDSENDDNARTALQHRGVTVKQTPVDTAVHAVADAGGEDDVNASLSSSPLSSSNPPPAPLVHSRNVLGEVMCVASSRLSPRVRPHGGAAPSRDGERSGAVMDVEMEDGAEARARQAPRGRSARRRFFFSGYGGSRRHQAQAPRADQDSGVECSEESDDTSFDSDEMETMVSAIGQMDTQLQTSGTLHDSEDDEDRMDQGGAGMGEGGEGDEAEPEPEPGVGSGDEAGGDVAFSDPTQSDVDSEICLQVQQEQQQQQQQQPQHQGQGIAVDSDNNSENMQDGLPAPRGVTESGNNQSGGSSELQVTVEGSQNNPQQESESAVERRAAEPSVGSIVDMLFDIHTILTQKQPVRTAASALAATNMVKNVFIPSTTPVPRDEQLEILENTRKMLECPICQDVFADAAETGCCGAVFDRDCIERWVHDRGTCPLCRESLSYSMMVPNRHVQRMANEMMVTCPWCSFNCKRSGLAEHKEECSNRPMDPPPPPDVLLRRSLMKLARGDKQSFRSFLVAPSPREANITQCYIRATRGGNYELLTLDGDICLMTAQRKRQLDMSVHFVIHMSYDCLNLSAEDRDVPLAQRQIGRLERNFVGSHYTILCVEPPTESGERSTTHEIGAVQYAATFGKTPRQMKVVIPAVVDASEAERSVDSQAETSAGGSPGSGSAPVAQRWTPASRDDTMLSQIDRPDSERCMALINKPPVWVDALDAYCLDFGGRVAAASVKNFLLASPDNLDETIMLFGRTADRNVYSMDFAYPFTPLQAFSIALSSMDSHLVTFD